VKKKVALTSRSIDYMASRGYLAENVEHFHVTGRKSDLFGFADLLCLSLKGNPHVLVQVTTTGNWTARKKKIVNNINAALLVTQSNFEVWVMHWKQEPKGWKVYTYNITTSDFDKDFIKQCKLLFGKQHQLAAIKLVDILSFQTYHS